MPIKDLTENVRLPRLGKIHLGIRHPEKGYPMKTDYFVLPKEHSDYNKLVKIFGEKPKELRILIPVEDEEAWASQYYKAYNQTYGLVCKGDGSTALRMTDVKTGELPNKDIPGTVTLKEIPCNGRNCLMYKSKKCQEVMNLCFLLPEVPGLGVWQIDTGSINSILNINSCAKIIKRAFGRISLIPLKLTFEPVQVNNPEDGRKQTVYVLNLRTDVTMVQLADAAREQAHSFTVEAPDIEAVIEKDIDSLYEGNQGTAGVIAQAKAVLVPATTAKQPGPTPGQREDMEAAKKKLEEEAHNAPVEASVPQGTAQETKQGESLLKGQIPLANAKQMTAINTMKANLGEDKFWAKAHELKLQSIAEITYDQAAALIGALSKVK